MMLITRLEEDTQVPGVWRLQVFYDEMLLHSRNPGAWAHVQGHCCPHGSDGEVDMTSSDWRRQVRAPDSWGCAHGRTGLWRFEASSKWSKEAAALCWTTVPRSCAWLSGDVSVCLNMMSVACTSSIGFCFLPRGATQQRYARISNSCNTAQAARLPQRVKVDGVHF
ncbi:unnamed protein product [Effrenium voratum]|nr:unnamed protein product [Effrenium voratum]